MAEQFGPYLLEDVVGQGGMGVVYRAYDTRRDRTVAVKRLPAHLAADGLFQARFRRESRLAARLSEPHVIPIHDFGEIDGQLFIDMRLVAGEDLSTLIAADRGTLPVEFAVDVVAQVASALDAAHSAGLVHRDVKPSNILVARSNTDRYSGFAYLVDFGIARGMAGSEGTVLTSTADTIGTVAYLAPERINGGSGDSRSDIYSLACVLFETLTGHAPFVGEPFQMIFAHVHAAPPSAAAERAGIPSALDAVIRRGMAKNPDERYQSAGELAAAARGALVGAPAGGLPGAAPGPGVAPGTVRLPEASTRPTFGAVGTQSTLPTRGGPGRRPGSLGIAGAVLAGCGAIMTLLAFTIFGWFTHRTGGDMTFGDLRGVVDRKNREGSGFGPSVMYYDWLAWVLLAVAGLFALLAVLPSPVSTASRVIGGLVAVVGISMTLLAAKVMSGTGWSNYVEHLSFARAGFYAALAGFLLLGLGAVLGPRRAARA